MHWLKSMTVLHSVLLHVVHVRHLLSPSLASLSLVVLRFALVLPPTILTLFLFHLVAAFYDAAAALDEKGVSGDGRVGVLNPRQYYELIQAVGSNGLVNRDAQGTALQVR